MDAIEHGFPRAVGGDWEMIANAEDACVRNKRTLAMERYMDKVSWYVGRWARYNEAEVPVQTKPRVIQTNDWSCWE